MVDSYQAIYDAVRSRISNGDIGYVVEQAAREAFSNFDNRMASVSHEFQSAGFEQQRPSVLMRPELYIDGNQWCAIYGRNLQSGVCGFGDTAANAMTDFDNNWLTQKVGEKNV